MSHCDIMGHAGLYGLGIRIGSYLQWAAVILSRYTCGEEGSKTLPNALKATTLFQLSFFVSLAWIIATDLSELYDIEVYIMTSFGFLNGVTLAAAGAINAFGFYDPGWSLAFLLLCALTTLGYIVIGIWFWFEGLTRLQAPCSYAFFYARLSIHGWFKYLNQVLFICNVIYAVANSAVLLRIGYRTRSRPLSWLSTAQSVRYRQSWGYAIGTLFFLGFSIVWVELTIFWSHVQGVGTLREADQLIPFIIGIAALLDWAVTYLKNKHLKDQAIPAVEKMPAGRESVQKQSDLHTHAATTGLKVEGKPHRGHDYEDLEAQIQRRFTT